MITTMGYLVEEGNKVLTLALKNSCARVPDNIDVENEIREELTCLEDKIEEYKKKLKR